MSSITLISSKTSSNSAHVNCSFSIVLYNSPPHHGFLGTLNFHMIVSLLKKWWGFCGSETGY